MRFDLLIKGGRIATGEGVWPGDIGILDGKIAGIGDLSGSDAQETFSAQGLLVMPGVIDSQVHFREPGMEHKEDLASGSRAALAGGVTAVLEMPNTNPPTTSREALEDKLRRAKGRMWCHYGFFIGAAADNVEQLGELEMLDGVPGVKIFVGSSTGSLLIEDDATLRRVLENGRLRCPIHSEDTPRLRERQAQYGDNCRVHDHPEIRDAECARIATERVLRVSKETHRPVHILHLSTADELPLLRRAKDEGLNTTVEITPQHLWFVAPDAYDRLGTKAQMNPPVRTDEHRQALRQALREGLFDIVGSDHAPHTLEEKALPYPKSPSGMPGVQTLLPVMLTLVRAGLLDIPQLVRLACENPAALYHIRSKGRLEVGYDADLTLVDPQLHWTVDQDWLESKCGWSPFEGEELIGKPIHVFLNGRPAMIDGQIIGDPAGERLDYDKPAATPRRS